MNNIKIVNNLGKDVKVEVNNGEVTITWNKEDRKLSDLKAGDAFKDSAGTEYIVCEQFDNGTTAVVRKDLLDNKMEFGETNDWRESKIREYLNGEYQRKLAEQFGEDNIVEFERDLTSLDGFDDYGKCQDKASVMSIIEYMRYHKHIGNCESWHYMLTPDSTPSGYGSDRRHNAKEVRTIIINIKVQYSIGKEITMYTIKGTDADTNIKDCLHPIVTSSLQYGHYYLFHTQFDIFGCLSGRITVNPLAFAVCGNRYGMDMCMDNHLYFIRMRTNNKLPIDAYDILKQCSYEYLYDITDAVREKGLEDIVAFLDNLKNDLLKPEQNHDSVEME